MKKLHYSVAAIFFLTAIALFWATPHYAVFLIDKAIASKDVPTFSRYMDKDSVIESLAKALHQDAQKTGQALPYEFYKELAKLASEPKVLMAMLAPDGAGVKVSQIKGYTGFSTYEISGINPKEGSVTLVLSRRNLLFWEISGLTFNRVG